jgi:hypothetical protein
MAEAALYILTGLTLYGGAHHLYLGARRPDDYPQLQLGGLYLLVAGFAFSSALTYQLAALGALLPSGKLDISFGIFVWVGLVWHVAFRTGCKPLLLLDLLTAVWAIFLIRNLTEPNSLLYAAVAPVSSAETLGPFFTTVSPWWTAMELAMLASLLFCFYACYYLYRRGRRAPALVTAAGLGLLSVVTLFDHLVSIQVIHASYLAPFGFVLFLLPASLYPLVRDWRQQRGPVAPPVIYNLTYMPDQATFHTDVSQLRTPLPGNPSQPGDNQSGRCVTPVRGASSRDDNRPRSTLVEMPAFSPAAAVTGPQLPADSRPRAAAPPTPVVDSVVLGAVTNNLIDIAVYATMALNRFKRGDADPRTLESLCKKVRSQAIETRRLVTRLEPSGSCVNHSAGRDD